MKKLLFASLSMVLMTVGTNAFAIDAAPPAPPTGTTASPAPDAVRAARQEERAKMKSEHKAEHSEMVTSVKAACTAEIQATGCSQDLGKGLMKCIRDYKKSNKEFTISETCKAARHDGREMHKEHKAERSKMKGSKRAKAAPAASSDNN